MSQIRVSHHTIIHDVAHVQNMWLWHLNLVYHTEHPTFDLQSEPLLVTPRAGGGWIRFKDIHFEMRCSVPAPSLWVMRFTRNFSGHRHSPPMGVRRTEKLCFEVSHKVGIVLSYE